MKRSGQLARVRRIEGLLLEPIERICCLAFRLADHYGNTLQKLVTVKMVDEKLFIEMVQRENRPYFYRRITDAGCILKARLAIPRLLVVMNKGSYSALGNDKLSSFDDSTTVFLFLHVVTKIECLAPTKTSLL